MNMSGSPFGASSCVFCFSWGSLFLHLVVFLFSYVLHLLGEVPFVFFLLLLRFLIMFFLFISQKKKLLSYIFHRLKVLSFPSLLFL